MARASSATIRVRHYTRVSGRDRILAEARILARDQNKVFVELADRKPLGPRKAEKKYVIKPGKGNAHVEFDALPAEVHRQVNRWTGEIEFFLYGEVDLSDLNPQGFKNRWGARAMTPEKKIKVAKSDLLAAWKVLENLAVSFDQMGSYFADDGSENGADRSREMLQALDAYLTPKLVLAINDARMRLGQYPPDKEAEAISDRIRYWKPDATRKVPGKAT